MGKVIIMKKLFKNPNGDIHFGTNSPEGFVECGKDDARKALEEIGERKLWRCNVCNDLHIGADFPDPCPTCLTEKAYVEISKKEFMGMVGL